MSANVQPVVFHNRAGDRLVGILHRPNVNVAAGTAVVLLSPGIKSRVGPHRLYVKLARRLCRAGFTVFRFDFYGLGDADRDLDDALLADVYTAVAAGRYLDDTLAAMDWLQGEHGIRRFILSGLCGGAITGLFAGQRDARVDGLIGLGIPVTQYGDALRYQYLTSRELLSFRTGYVKKVFDPASWLRLLTLKSDYRIIWKAFVTPLANRLRSNRSAAAAGAAAPGAAAAETASNLNPHFGPAFFGMLGASRKMLLAFGQADRLYWEFDEKFAQPHARQIARYRAKGVFELALVEGARHVFEAGWQQDRLFQIVESWLKREYGSASAADVA